MLSLLLPCHLLLPALRGSNRARVVWQWSYQILRLHKMAGESHQMEVLAFPNPGWEQHRRCSWCVTPTARWCDRCESSFLCPVTGMHGRALCSFHDQPMSVNMCRTCFAELHKLSLKELDEVFRSGPGPWRRAFIAGAYYSVPHD